MWKLVTCAAMAFAVTASSLALIAPASAQNLELRVGPGGVETRLRDDDNYRGDRRDERRYREERRDDDDRRARRRGCDPDLAISIAREDGLRRARLVAASERRLVVEGRVRDRRECMIFANRRGCPVIG